MKDNHHPMNLVYWVMLVGVMNKQTWFQATCRVQKSHLWLTAIGTCKLYMMTIDMH